MPVGVPCGKVCLDHNEKQPLDMKRAGEVKKKKLHVTHLREMGHIKVGAKQQHYGCVLIENACQLFHAGCSLMRALVVINSMLLKLCPASRMVQECFHISANNV